MRLPVLLLSGLLGLASVPAGADTPTFRVVIDPGHGGEFRGALGPRGVKEKDVTLAIAKALQAELADEPGVEVLLTRDGDVDVGLHDRMLFANRRKADAFISIHCNSMPTRHARKAAYGIETYFLMADASDAAARMLAERENADAPEEEAPRPTDPIGLILQDLTRTQAHEDASLLARAVHRNAITTLRTRNRGVRQAPFYVLIGAEMPAVLIEIGFISHPSEGRRLAKPAHQQAVAKALRAGVLQFRDEVFLRRAAPVAAAGAPPEAVPPEAVPPEAVPPEAVPPDATTPEAPALTTTHP